ncbi:MAG: 5'/3'-nucleotidase SurE [Phycisphaerales bacterium]
MRVLLTNDDGIRAPGLLALHRALAEIAEEVFVVAPLTVQSATSHGVTFHQPLMTQPIEVNGQVGIAVDGRPADCVKLALTNLWPEHMGGRPDLVVSGMNAGANVGINVIYSGTVAAALEAAFLGVPSIAVSMHIGRGRTLFEAGARHAMRAIRLLLKGEPLEPHTCLNINVPRCELPPTAADDPASIARQRAASGATFRPLSERGAEGEVDPDAEMPVVVCPMNTHGIADRFEQRSAPDGQIYFWSASGGFDFHETEPGSDVDYLFRRCITVTPLRYDLTDEASLGRWKELIQR